MDWGNGVGNAVIMVAILHDNATDVYAFPGIYFDHRPRPRRLSTTTP